MAWMLVWRELDPIVFVFNICIVFVYLYLLVWREGVKRMQGSQHYRLNICSYFAYKYGESCSEDEC